MIFVLIAVVGAVILVSSLPRKSGNGPPAVAEQALPPPVAQALPPPVAQAPSVRELQPKGSFFRFITRVVAVTGAIIVLCLLGAKWYRRRMRLGGSDRLQMAVKGRFYLGPKHSLVMIDVDDRRLLLGMTESSINLITELSTGTSPVAPEPVQPEAGETFKSLLTRLRKKDRDGDSTE